MNGTKKREAYNGIIFGAKNYAAVHKFLTIAWKRNAINGEADFDIDEDESKFQLDLFDGKKMTKIEKFQNGLTEKLLDGTLTTNKDVVLYSYANGHIPKHSEGIVKQLKKDGKLHYEGKAPLLTYENVFRKGNIINFTIKS